MWPSWSLSRHAWRRLTLLVEVLSIRARQRLASVAMRSSSPWAIVCISQYRIMSTAINVSVLVANVVPSSNGHCRRGSHWIRSLFDVTQSIACVAVCGGVLAAHGHLQDGTNNQHQAQPTTSRRRQYSKQRWRVPMAEATSREALTTCRGVRQSAAHDVHTECESDLKHYAISFTCWYTDCNCSTHDAGKRCH